MDNRNVETNKKKPQKLELRPNSIYPKIIGNHVFFLRINSFIKTVIPQDGEKQLWGSDPGKLKCLY